MTIEQIAKKYVHGMHDALTDRQEIKDMMTDIETYAESYHQAKLKLLGVSSGSVSFPSEKCDEACYYHCTKGERHQPECIKEDKGR